MADVSINVPDPEANGVRCVSCGHPDHPGSCRSGSFDFGGRTSMGTAQEDRLRETARRAREEEERQAREEERRRQAYRRSVAAAALKLVRVNLRPRRRSARAWLAGGAESLARTYYLISVPRDVAKAENAVAGALTQSANDYLDRIAGALAELAVRGRKRKWNVAASLLEEYLSGAHRDQGERRLEVSWLRACPAVRDAERTNHEHIEDGLADLVRDLTTTQRLPDHGSLALDPMSSAKQLVWSRAIDPGLDDELHYASGFSQLDSVAQVRLERDGTRVRVKGVVDHFWHDRFDFNRNDWFLFPGEMKLGRALPTRLWANDIRLLEKHRGAVPFELRATWSQTFEGTIRLDKTGRPSFSWGKPTDG